MRQTKRSVVLYAAIGGAVAVALGADLSAVAQLAPTPIDPNQRQVYLVRKDQADCTNSDVPNVDSPMVAGNVWVTRLQDGNTSVKVALTAKPATTYRFSLDEGVGMASFAFSTSLVGAVYAFDVVPEGAPPGNKFQSAQVSFR